MSEEKIMIITYGVSRLKKEYRPNDVDAEFDASSWIKKYPKKDKGKDKGKGNFNLKKVNGTMKELQQAFLGVKQFTSFIDFVYETMVKHKYTKVSIFCRQGRHRSVASAEILAKKFPNCTVKHMCL